ncbi:alpha-N-acetylglucosaminidase [Dyella mobilis]|uniref:Alpha-N-acetylglucosaminidase n=1 Tax=Dyella mobilis TaxID=1849582 RepID=A0ABS2KH71_9GAMM|nr:alpha-N-acetylglucosaminidase [Dyella mobilis]MBM7130107.1 alpha-N-acetylglucosaminidase [Dyella mobilis]GLQ96734.1 alpha-N-acetylglucosaminidase [Dyella mobilis]
MRTSTACFWLAAVAALGWNPIAQAAQAPAFDTHPAQALLLRLLPHQAQQFTLSTLPPARDHERFRISTADDRIKVEGSTPSALLFGVNWYLKYVAHVQISPNGDRIGSAPFPLPKTPIERETPYTYRYALNENVDGYTTAYWDGPRWQREIDVLALSGINAVLIERGMDSVLYRTFRDVGYSDDEVRAWITQPAHQNWQLMGNMCCFNGPISLALMRKRAESTQKIVARLRELGITPVFPGFYGIVPADFQKKFPHAHVIPQGEWVGFTRPGWLDPRDPMFAKLATAFYRHQHELYGDSSIYDMEVFQEGGKSGDVPVPAAASAVQNAMLAAHPDAHWMMLAWHGNPRQDLLSGIDRQHVLIVDIGRERVSHDDREKDFQGAPYLFGGLWEFGGCTTLGANTRNIVDELPLQHHTNQNLAGTAVFTEGMGTNPFALDLFTEMAWRSDPVDLAQWTGDYVLRRYGAADPHALAAWKVLLNTAYDIHMDNVDFDSERDAAQESLFDAQPSLDARSASSWSPKGMRYDPEIFKQALPELLQVAPALRDSDTYQYDLVDVARQTLANESRALLPRIKTAYEGKDRTGFEALTRRWLQLMDLQDQLLASNRFFLVGSWLARVDSWASTPEEGTRLAYDARSLLTTWGDRKASEDGGLHDYGNKDWAGLTRDYYRLRWETYFRSLDDALRTGTAPKQIDWFAMGDAWNHGTQHYTDQPAGDAYAIASLVAEVLHLPVH